MNRKHLFFWIFIVGLMETSCNIRQNKVTERKTADSVSLNVLKKDKNIKSKHKVIHYDLFSVDSIVGNYHIQYKSQENGKMIITHPITDGKGNDTIYYACQDVVLDVAKDGQKRFINKRIQIDDFRAFIPKNEISKYCISNFKMTDVTTSYIKFSINICMPETDICYWFNLIVSDSGDFNIKEFVEKESDM
ncbi:MAG: DUF4738 domain-containing protein [Bacteroidales bacterium]|nr:DUF4738 domain-containing protein [Bacteroidales bacterium]